MTTIEELASPAIIEKSQTYEQYCSMIEERLERSMTTGENHSETLLHNSKMNLLRMKRLDKHITLSADLQERLRTVRREMLWLVYTEGWSGDAAQIIPVLNKMAESSPAITLRMLLRDRQMDAPEPITGPAVSRSIPMLIALDPMTSELLGSWGPRTQTAQRMADAMTHLEGTARKEAAERLHSWYADDNSREIQEEFDVLIDRWDR